MSNNGISGLSRIGITLALLFVAISLTQTTASAQSASFSRTDFPSLGNNHIAVDVNGDGILDLVATGLNSAAVMLGNGNGTFRTKVDFPVGSQAQDVAAGDFNGDARVDLVVSLSDPSISVSLLRGNGDGTFGAPVNIANSSGADSPAIVAADLDNDGRLDVVLAHAISCFVAPCSISRDITVLLGLGDGTFQQPFEIAVGTGMSRIAVGDFNRDGIKDLGIAGDSSQLYILLGVGNGTFLQQPTITLTADTLAVDGTDIDIADLNRDTIEDLVVAIPLNGSRTAVLLGRGDGTFGPPSILTEPNLLVPQYQAIADFNRDGLLDLALALANGNSGLLEIRLGNGDGTFRSPTRYFTPPAQSSIGGGTVVTGDFNRDGRADLALPITGARPALASLVNSTGNVSAQPPLTVSALTLNPSSVVGGNSVQGKVTLSAAAPAATVVTLASNSARATVPASITIAAGASSGTFTIGTTAVTTTVTASISATLNGVSRSATLTINPAATTPPPSTDTVSITRAEYDSGKRALRVEATSTSSNATLQVFVSATGQLIGTLSNNGGGQYRGEFTVSTNPQNITVRSNQGGVATRSVTAR